MNQKLRIKILKEKPFTSLKFWTKETRRKRRRTVNPKPGARCGCGILVFDK